VRVTTAHADIDGNHRDDTLTVYGTGTDSAPAPYHLHVDLGSGAGAADTVITDADPTGVTSVKALGGSDITASSGGPPDGSGDEAFVTIGAGASATLVAVFQLRDCHLTRLTGPNSAQPAAFAIGGSVTHLDGLRCDGSAGGVRLVQLSAESDDGVTYHTTESRLLVDGGQFVVTGTVNDSIAANDPRLQPFSSLDCPGVGGP